MIRRTVVRVFISSSGDCDSERRALHRSVHDYNRVACAALDHEIDAFGPDDLYSGIGAYGQDVANRQLMDYDIYVGLWRERIGTPTPAAPSGTVEELRGAVERHSKTRRPWIMAYFWESSPTDFSHIKNELKEHGCYFHQYKEPEQLADMFRTHLSGYIRDQFRLPGHSSTRMESNAGPSVLNSVHLTFQVHSPDGSQKKVTFNRSAVAVGRQPESNQIVCTGDRVHREQGLFIWKDGIVFYVDLAGDSRIEHAAPAAQGSDDLQYGLHAINVGDSVTLPDGTRLLLRAVVD